MKTLLIVSFVVLLHALVCHTFAYANASSSPVALLSSTFGSPLSNEQTRRLVVNSEPNLTDADGWAADLLTALLMNNLPRNKENACAMVAVIDQESSFASNPVVPNLGKIAAKTTIRKVQSMPYLADAQALVYLETKPDINNSYLNRIRASRTEKDLDMVYSDFMRGLLNPAVIDFFTDFIEQHNDIATIGSMQVAVRFAMKQEQERHHKNMAINEVLALRDLMYTRKGGMYYGAMQLLGFESGYSQKIHRFADFNAGRNTAFQSAIAMLLKTKLALDGDLLGYASNGSPLQSKSKSEAALFELSKQHLLGLGEAQIRMDLLLEKQHGFVKTKTYDLVRREYARIKGIQPPFAILPEISLKSEKISGNSKMNTAIFAKSVNKRYRQCMNVKLDS